jgi:hypothetical protein
MRQQPERARQGELGCWSLVCHQLGASAAGVGQPTSCPSLMAPPHHWPRWSAQAALATSLVCASSLSCSRTP